MTAIVRARGLTRRVSDVVTLAGADFEIMPGQAVGLASSSGADRTTLLRLVATLLRPSAGELSIAGVDAIASPFDARRHLMYVGRQAMAGGGLTVAEYIHCVWAARLGTRRSTAAGAVAAAIEQAQLPADEIVDRLPAAMRHRLALAAALAAAPPLVLVDQPIPAAGSAERLVTLECVKALRAQGATLIVAIDDQQDADALCDLVMYLEHGRIGAVSHAPALAYRGGVAAAAGIQ